MALVSKNFSDIITFSRASAATRVNASGLVESVAANTPRFDYDPITLAARGILIEEQRTNLALYSNDFANAWWNKIGGSITSTTEIAPDGSTTACVFSASATNAELWKSVTLAASTIYTSSIYIKRKTGTGTISIRNSANTNWIPVTINSSTWTRVTNDSGASGGNAYCDILVSTLGDEIYVWGAQLEAGSFATSYIPSTVTFTGRSSTGTFIGANGLIQTAASGVARLQYNPANLSVAPFLLLEESRTNLLYPSEQFDDAAWSKNQASVSANSVVSPDGTQNADKLFGSVVNAEHYAEQSIATVANQTYTQSVYVKPDSSISYFAVMTVHVGLALGTSTVVLQNSSGVVSFVSQSGIISRSSVEAVGGGWYRVTWTYTLSGTVISHRMRLYSQALSNGVTVLSGDGVSGVCYWGAQLETGSYPTSYIPTTTAQVTRAADTSTSSQTTRSADVASVNTLSPWFNASAGTLFSEFDVAATTAGSGMSVVSIAAASTNGYLLYKGLSAAGLFAYTDGNSASLGNLTVNAVAKAAIAYDGVNNAGVLNGATPAAITPVAVTAPTLMYVGGSYSVTPLSGHIRSIKYFPRRLSNTELQALTA